MAPRIRHDRAALGNFWYALTGVVLGVPLLLSGCAQTFEPTRLEISPEAADGPDYTGNRRAT